MPDTLKYEIRDPIHGFVGLSEWEKDIVDHWVFQRLRRIRQLGFTDMVYPGAMHTRFEHSLGVMHIATRMFDEITKRRGDFLRKELHFDEPGLGRDRAIVRLASLLHDVGHTPFSHAGEELMCEIPGTDKKFKHENYSAAAVEHLMADVIDDHKYNHLGIKAKDIAGFLNGSPSLGKRLIWRHLISGQLDADRADYLLRDSKHAGVAYGNFDLDRILKTLTVVVDPETEDPRIAVQEDGIHAVEGLIIARYMMFTQVYFQHTRRAFDNHIAGAVKELLCKKYKKKRDGTQKGVFPPPNSKKNVLEYLKWNDWYVLGQIQAGKAGNHGSRIAERRHDRSVYETGEYFDGNKLNELEKVCTELGEKVAFVDSAEKTWYKHGSSDIRVHLSTGQHSDKVTILSQQSPVVQGLKSVNQSRIYAHFEDKEEARKIVKEITK